MSPDFIQAADCVSRFFRKCREFDLYLETTGRKPVIEQDAAKTYFKAGMTVFEKGKEALILEETLDQTLIILGLKYFH